MRPWVRFDVRYKIHPRMTTPLIDRPHWQPAIALLKREGWAVPLFALLFIRGMHGLPSVFHAIFSVRKTDIGAYEPIFSRHDLWVLHSGLLSIISALILAFVIIRWIRLLRSADHSAHQADKETKSEQGVAPQPAARSESDFVGSLPPST